MKIKNNKELEKIYLQKLQPLPSPVMKKIKILAKKLEVPIVSDEIGRLLHLLVNIYKPKKILELGTGIGYSTHWMLLATKNCKITSLDQNKERISIAKKFLLYSDLAARVDLKNIWIEDFFLQNKKKEFDFIFLDSQKSTYDKILKDIFLCLKKNGLLLVDNVLFKGQIPLAKDLVSKKYKNAVLSIQKFNKKIFQSQNWETHLFPLGDGVIVAKKIKGIIYNETQK